MTEPAPTPKRRRGVVAVIMREERFLVIKRSQHVVAPGRLCFPGGGIEHGETEPEALLREMREELAITISPQRLLWQSTTPWNVDLSWWRVHLDHDASPCPNPAEVADVRWLGLQEMAALPALLESNRDFIAALQAGVFSLD